ERHRAQSSLELSYFRNNLNYVMKRFLNIAKENHHKIFKYFLVIIAIGIIVSIFPREGKFKYEFQKGKPWIHETLIAPFDFTIAKTPAEIEEETQQIIENKKLFFIKNPGIKEKSVVGFSQKLDEEFPAFLNKLIAAENSEVSKEDSAAIKLSLKAKGVEILENLYEKGIIQINSAIQGKDPEFPLVLTENTVAEDRLRGDFHSIQSA